MRSFFRISLGFLLFEQFVLSSSDETLSIDKMFNVMNLKKPQLYGIIAGCIVFIITIITVITLLMMSKFYDVSIATQNQPKSESLPPQYASQAELYDYLLEAASKLPLKPDPPTIIGKQIRLQKISSAHLDALTECCDGCAIFGESSYDPMRILGWMESYWKMQSLMNENSQLNSKTANERVAHNKALAKGFVESIIRDNKATTLHLVIIDNTLEKPIGMISLLDNNPRDLCLRIGNIWLTPAYQRQKIAHEVLLHLLDWIFHSGYRRVTCEIDSRHIIMKKFLERCNFKMEAILRKHMIINRRNRDTALYVMLNSEWKDAEVKLKIYLGISIFGVKQKIAEIDYSELKSSAGQITTTDSKRTVKRKKKKAAKANVIPQSNESE